MIISSKDILKTLGKNVKIARKRLGYTQEYVAENISISIDLLRNIENGRNIGSITTLLNICNFLHVSPNTLLGDLLYFKEDTLDSSLSSRMSKFSKEDRKLLKQVIVYIDKNY